jgi:glycosyltransferase involved in cell wall biosynthesis
VTGTAAGTTRRKVLLVTPYFHPHVGGVESYTAQLTARLSALGWTVVVVTTGSANADRERLDGARVYRLKPTATLSNTPVGIGWRKKLREILETEQPDVINAHTPVPYLADIAQRCSGPIPFVLTYHNDLAKQGVIAGTLARLAHLTLIRRTLHGSHTIIATSEYYALESPYLKHHRPKVEIVPPGVDLARFNPEVSTGARLAATFAGTRVILFVGSLNRGQRHKGLDVLIDAFALIHRDSPDVRLVVVGDGDSAAAYQARAQSLGLGEAVTFSGHVSDDELAEYYKCARVMAMPSTTRSEGFGMVYLEASAVGTPVVGTRIGGVPYAVLDGETGLLARPGDTGSLHLALRRLLDDDDLARRLGLAGSARARAEFGWPGLAERTAAILGRAAAGSRRSPAPAWPA